MFGHHLRRVVQCLSLGLLFGISFIPIRAHATPPPDFAYTLSLARDPVKPGERADFVLTATNLSGTAQSATLTFTAPPNTTPNNTGQLNNLQTLKFTSVPTGATQSIPFNLLLGSGASAPAEGTVIQLDVTDQTRGLTVSRSFTVRNVPLADLELSTSQGTAAPGEALTCTLTYRNAGPVPLTNFQVSLPLPAGAGFVSASGNGAQAGGAIVWTIANLPAAGVGRVQAVLSAPQTAGVMLLEAALQDSSQAILAQANGVKRIMATPELAYALTVAGDRIAQGEQAIYQLSVTNLSPTPQDAKLVFFTPPNSTSPDSGFSNDLQHFNFTGIAVGATQSLVFALAVPSGAGQPANGSLVDLTLLDADRVGTVSRTVVVESSPLGDLEFSTGQACVAAGSSFTYTLSYSNAAPAALANARINLPLPAGVTFVSSDRNQSTASDGSLQWDLGTLAPAATGQLQVTLAAPASGNGAALQFEAAFSADNPGLLATADSSMSINASPDFAYTLTVASDRIPQGSRAICSLTATNLNPSPLSTVLSFLVPPNCTSPDSAFRDNIQSFSFTNVASGASETKVFALEVPSGGSVPNGSLIDLLLTDQSRALSVSRCVVVEAAPLADVQLSTAQGLAQAGQNFTYTLDYHNAAPTALPDALLTLSVPAGATFVPGGGGTLNGHTVQWDLQTLAAGSDGKVTATFTAPANSSAPLRLEAALSSGGTLLAQASSGLAIKAIPDFTYTLTTTDTRVGPGQRANYTLQVTNQNTTPLSVVLSFLVPPNCTSPDSGFSDDLNRFSFNNVAPGASAHTDFALQANGGSSAPADGTLLDLILTDLSSGAIVSRTLPIAGDLGLGGSLAFGDVQVKTAARRTLLITNRSDHPFTVNSISFPAGFTGAFRGAVPAHATKAVAVTFSPKDLVSYGGAITVSSTALSGNNKITVSGTGAPPLALASAGVFRGLLGNNDAFLTVSVGRTGAFSVQYTTGGVLHALSGKLDVDGNFAGVIKPGIPLSLHAAPGASAANPGDFVLSGSVDGQAFQLAHATYAATQIPAEPGKLTLLLTEPQGGAPSPFPQGYGLVAVGKGGNVTVTGRLPDGTAFSAASTLVGSAQGHVVPLLARLTYLSPKVRGALGSLGGTLQFAAQAGHALDTDLDWTKPEQTAGPDLPAFQVTVSGRGYLYLAPTAKQKALANFNSGTLTLADDATLSVQQGVTLNSTDHFVLTLPRLDSLSLVLVPSTGFFSGAFKYPGATFTAHYYGVLIQEDNGGIGLLVGPHGPGTVTLGPAAAVP